MQRYYLIIAGLVIGTLLIFTFNQQNSGEDNNIPLTTPSGESKSLSRDSYSEKSKKPDETTQIKNSAYEGGKLPFRFEQSTAKLANDPNDATQLLEEATALGSKKVSPSVEIDYLLSLLRSFRVVNSGYYPTGFNYEITNALLGDNKRKTAFISASNSRINKDGELVDQWNTPYHFHSESSTKLNIRSAGPDRVMYTTDDITLFD